MRVCTDPCSDRTITGALLPLWEQLTTMDAGQPERNRKVIDVDAVSSASELAEPLPPGAARIVALFREGYDVAAIVKELWPKSQTGSNYQRRSAAVQAVLRQHM